MNKVVNSLLLLTLLWTTPSYGFPSCGDILKWFQYYTYAYIPGNDEITATKIDQLKTVIEAKPYQIKALRGARSLLTPQEFYNLDFAPNNAFLLGPDGPDYKTLIENTGIGNFWQAFKAVGMSGTYLQTRRYVRKFLRKLILESPHEIYFFLPADLTEHSKTQREFNLLASDPKLISRVNFIFAPRDFSGETEYQ